MPNSRTIVRSSPLPADWLLSGIDSNDSVCAMARVYRFVQVDVFTDRLFGGNQLAVFLEPEGLSDSEMQSIAREMNLSETTFVFPPTQSDAVARVRIFTPGAELPFAGHPTDG